MCPRNLSVLLWRINCLLAPHVAAALLMAIRNVRANVFDLLISTSLYLRLYILGPFYFPPWIAVICTLF